MGVAAKLDADKPYDDEVEGVLVLDRLIPTAHQVDKRMRRRLH